MSRFLILHGLDGSGPGHWQRWLAARLEAREPGSVRFPELPEPSDPKPERWLSALRRELAALAPASPVVICHSLACLLWLRAAAAHDGALAERVLLVAPPRREDMPAVARFLDHGAGAADVARAASRTQLVCTDDDPYCPGGATEAFGRPLAIETIVVTGGGHLNIDAGYGPWPAAEAWALDGEVGEWSKAPADPPK